MKNLIIFALIALITSSCVDDKCIDAEDFGFKSYSISSRYPSSMIEGSENNQVAPWYRTSFVANGEPITIIVKNWDFKRYAGSYTSNNPRELSAWSPFYGNKNDFETLSATNERLKECEFLGSMCNPTHSAQLANPPCIFKRGVGLYGLLSNTNPNISRSSKASPQGITFHVGDPQQGFNLYHLGKPVGGIVYKFQDDNLLNTYGTSRLWFKIFDRYYSDNSGKYQIIIKSGADNLEAGPVRKALNLVREQIFGSGDNPEENYGVVKRIYTSVLENSSYKLIVSGALTLYVMFIGFAFIIGSINLTKSELIIRVMKITIVTVLMNSQVSWNFFHDNLFKIFIDGADSISGKFIVDGSNSRNGLAFFDDMITLFFSMQTLAKLLSLLFTSPFGIVFIVCYIALAFFYMKILLRAVMIYLMCLMTIGVIISVAPIFICFLLFNMTQSLAQNWLKLLITYTLQPLILLVGLSMSSNLIKHEIHTTLGFKVCKFNIIDMGSLFENMEAMLGTGKIEFPNSLIYWWFPKPSPGKLCNNESKFAVIPVPESFINKDGDFCPRYGCTEKRCIDMPFINLNNKYDRAKLKLMNGKASFANFEAILIFLALVYLLQKFNEAAVRFSNSIAGSTMMSAQIQNAAEAAAKGLPGVMLASMKVAAFAAKVAYKAVNAPINAAAKSSVGKAIGGKLENINQNIKNRVSKVQNNISEKVSNISNNFKESVSKTAPVKGIIQASATIAAKSTAISATAKSKLAIKKPAFLQKLAKTDMAKRLSLYSARAAHKIGSRYDKLSSKIPKNMTESRKSAYAIYKAIKNNKILNASASALSFLARHRLYAVKYMARKALISGATAVSNVNLAKTIANKSVAAVKATKSGYNKLALKTPYLLNEKLTNILSQEQGLNLKQIDKQLKITTELRNKQIQNTTNILKEAGMPSSMARDILKDASIKNADQLINKLKERGDVKIAERLELVKSQIIIPEATNARIENLIERRDLFKKEYQDLAKLKSEGQLKNRTPKNITLIDKLEKAEERSLEITSKDLNNLETKKKELSKKLKSVEENISLTEEQSKIKEKLEIERGDLVSQKRSLEKEIRSSNEITEQTKSKVQEQIQAVEVKLSSVDTKDYKPEDLKLERDNLNKKLIELEQSSSLEKSKVQDQIKAVEVKLSSVEYKISNIEIQEDKQSKLITERDNLRQVLTEVDNAIDDKQRKIEKTVEQLYDISNNKSISQKLIEEGGFVERSYNSSDKIDLLETKQILIDRSISLQMSASEKENLINELIRSINQDPDPDPDRQSMLDELIRSHEELVQEQERINSKLEQALAFEDKFEKSKYLDDAFAKIEEKEFLEEIIKEEKDKLISKIEDINQIAESGSGNEEIKKELEEFQKELQNLEKTEENLTQEKNKIIDEAKKILKPVEFNQEIGFNQELNLEDVFMQGSGAKEVEISEKEMREEMLKEMQEIREDHKKMKEFIQEIKDLKAKNKE